MRLPESFHDFPVSRTWRAAWIRPPRCGAGVSRYLFRREVGLDAVRPLTLYISAGHTYELYVNGDRVASGPPPSQPYWKYYDEHAIAPHLREGFNCIGVTVHGSRDEPVGVLGELVDDQGRMILGTDARWRVTDQHGWRTEEALHLPHRQEVFDARRHPQGWDAAGFDDADWRSADVLPSAWSTGKKALPWLRLVPSGVPAMIETRECPRRVTVVEEGQEVLSRGREESLSVQLSAAGRPLTRAVADGVASLVASDAEAQFRCSLDHLGNKACDGIWCPAVVLDFGQVYSGHFEMTVEGPAGAIVEIGYVERLLNGHFNNAMEVFYADRYALRAGRQTFRCAIWKSFRFVKLRFSRCFEPVVVSRVQAVACAYPFRERGAFESADHTLTGAFDICRRTIRLCARDYLMDSPWREKSQWTGDISAVTLGGLYACFGDTALACKFLRQAIVNQAPHGLMANNFHGFSGPGSGSTYSRIIPDYSLWWISALWQHYLYTGEERILHEGYPAVSRILQFHFHYINASGFIAGLPGWVFIDHVFQCRAEELAVYNALFYGVLEDVARMAELKADRWMQEKVEVLRRTLKANFHARFFDETEGVYVDGCTDGEPVATISEHTNAAAMLWGLCPSAAQDRIVERLYVRRDREYLEAQPFFTSVVLRALARCERMDLALDIIRDRWGGRMLEAGMTSTTEEWNATGSWRGADNAYVGIFRSLSHAWSAFPAEFLTRYLIGLQILTPGCARVRLAPCRTPLDYRVVYPLPQGNLDVHLEGGRLDVHAPSGVEAQTV